MSNCHWCGGDCGGTCLGLTQSTQMQTSDPAYFLLNDGHVSTPTVHKDGCYICEDPEFAQMGLPLCTKCPKCGGHVPADDTACDTDGCDYDAYEAWEREQLADEHREANSAAAYEASERQYGQEASS